MFLNRVIDRTYNFRTPESNWIRINNNIEVILYYYILFQRTYNIKTDKKQNGYTVMNIIYRLVCRKLYNYQ